MQKRGSDNVTAARVFQSLFSWNLLLMPARRHRSAGYPDVSILVFVELALDVNVVVLKPVESTGFNPCFRGTCS